MAPLLVIFTDDGVTSEQFELEHLIAVNIEAMCLEGEDAEAFGRECRDGIARDGFVRFGGGAAGRCLVALPDRYEAERGWVAA